MRSRPPATRFKLRWLITAALAAFALYVGWIEPRRLVVREARLTLPNWPAQLRGLKAVAISDLHGGGLHITRAQLDRVVAAANAARPDLIVLLGDFVRTGVGWKMPPEEVAAALQPLSAPLGVFAVLGNHDWWLDGTQVWKSLEAVGIRVLEDQSIALDRGGTKLWLSGIPDRMTRDANPKHALREVPAGATVLALTHNPDVFPEVPARVALTLAGHTHGGQVRLPFVGRLVVPSRFGQRYAAGHVVEDGRQLFVTTGVGTSILPLRLGVPPEIVVLTLE
jgi:uncharacterized protein